MCGTYTRRGSYRREENAVSTDAESFFGRPNFERGRFGWAVITQTDGSEQLYRRATTVAGYMEDKEGLIGWKSAMAAFGFTRSKSLLSALSVLDWKNDKSKVKEIVERAQALGGGSDAADLGTAFHRVIERHVMGEVLDYDRLPDGFGEALDAFIQFQKDFGITVSASELTVVDDANQVAGTADAVFSFNEDVTTPFGKIKAGQGVIGDFKTGSVSDLAGMKMGQQLSIYSHADPYDAGRGVRTPWPIEMNPDIGLVLKIDLDNAKVIPWWLDLKSAYEWIQLSLKVAATRTAAKKIIKQAPVAASKGTNEAPAAAEVLGAREVGKLITAATSQDELAEIRAQHESVFTEKMNERWEAKFAEFPDPTDKDEDQADDMSMPSLDSDEAEAEVPVKSDLSAEIRTVLGKANTVADLEAVTAKYGMEMSDKQKAFVVSQTEKYEAAEAATAPMDEGMPDWVLEDDETPAKVEPWSIEDATAQAAEVSNKGELRDLFKKFHRAIQSGEASPDTLAVITARSNEL